MDRSALTVGPGMDLPIMHDSDRYELVKDIGSGNFGIAGLMRDKQTKELVAVKYIERGEKGPTRGSSPPCPSQPRRRQLKKRACGILHSGC